MTISLSTDERIALDQDSPSFRATSERTLAELLLDLQSQATAHAAALAALASQDADFADLLAALAPVAVPTWGAPGDEAAEAIEIALQLKDGAEESVGEELVFEVHVADTENGADSATAVITAAAVPVGEILSGSGTACVKVKTSATGALSLLVTEAAAGSRFLEIRPCYGSGAIDCRDVAELTFAGE